jgi:NTP pyrophosphatase (non-canonical NTP hydrolase)
MQGSGAARLDGGCWTCTRARMGRLKRKDHEVDEYLDLAERLCAFRDERDWKQFHNPKDLAISISLEAAELLEAFQWSGADTSSEGREDKIREELADVLIYCFYMADACGLDPLDIMRAKLEKNRQKYPVALSRGSSKKYTELEEGHEKSPE